MFPSLDAIEIKNPIIDIEDSEAFESESILDLARRSHIIDSWNCQVSAAIAQASSGRAWLAWPSGCDGCWLQFLGRARRGATLGRSWRLR